MNSFSLKGIDSRLVSKIMNTKYVFEEDIEYLAKIEEFQRGEHLNLCNKSRIYSESSRNWL